MQPDTAGTLTVSTIPDLRLWLNGEPVSGLVNTKGAAIVAYLALTGGMAPRARLAGLLWSDLPDQDALNNLRFTLSKLRRQLPGVIEATRRDLRLAASFGRQLDVDALEAADTSALVGLRVEDFLAQFLPAHAEAFTEWAAQQRAELGARYLARVAGHAAALAARGEAEGAAEAYRRCLALAPWSEVFHRALAQLHAHSGDEAGALAQLAACREALRRDLDVEPEPETVQLEDDLRQRRRTASQPTAATPGGQRAPVPGELDVGMEAERTRLRDLVLSPASRIVTLLGPGGAGKTHLARVVLHELATAFEHGMAVVRLDDLAPCRAGRGSAALLSRLAAAVGTDLVPGRELDSLAEGLRGRQQIVLVDNFETVADAWPTLGALSERLPGVTFVVTSRHQLGLPTEWVVRLHGLDWPRTARWQPAHGAVPAPALFLGAAERLGLPVDTARDGDAVIRICAAVEGWPLGLILSASWLQVYGCAAVAARLEGSAALLANPAPARIEPRHRSATAVLDQSWALLDGEERAGFAALCVFAGRFDVAAAEAVAGVTAATLAALVGKSLVRREAGDALSVHPLLRDYGHRQLDAMPALRDRVHAAHAARSAAMLAAARDAFGACGDPAAFDAAAERVGDHLAAFRRLAVAPDRPGLDGFLGDLWLLHRSRGWIEDGAALLEEALALPGLDAGRVAQWRLWHSDALFQLGRVDASGEAARAALAALGERPAVGAGGAAVAAGLARVLLRQPRRAPGGHGATVAARAWNRIAQARFFEGDRDGFVAATLRSVTYRGAGSLPANLASTALVLGYTPFRASAARAALRAERTLHAADPFDRAWAHEQLALHGLGLGELDAARHHALEGAAIFRRLGQRRNWGECQTLATYGHFFAGRIAAARDEMAAVRDEARRLHEPAAELWGALGVLACDLMTGGAAEAFDDRRARSLAAAVPDPNTRLLLHGILAWRAACEGRPDEAREERQRFDMAFRSADMLSVYALNGFVADFRALLVLCEATPGDLHHAARRPISRLRRFARTFPAARPRLAEAVRLVRDARLPGGRGRDA